MQTLTATYRIVTPMFLGGADQTPSDGIRPPSVKGALRFWWRALSWGRFRAGATDDEAALKKLHEKEAKLFGSATDDKNGGQGLFLLRLERTRFSNEVMTTPAPAGIGYLLGQGLYDPRNGGKYNRAALAKNQDIKVTLLFKGTVSVAERQEIEKTLWMLGLLGNLGSRARRGFGSLSLQAIEGSTLDQRIPTDADSYRDIFNALIGNNAGISTPPFTAFSNDSRIDISGIGTDPMAILDSIGREFIKYRSNGITSRTAGNRWLPNLSVNVPIAGLKFWPDLELAHNVASGTSVTNHPARVVFGLPHNYFFSTVNNNKVEMQPIHQDLYGNWVSDSRGRRASPLLIHVHRFNDQSYGVVQTFLPATFLPVGDHIEMTQLQRNARGYTPGLKVTAVGHSVIGANITDYMNIYTGRSDYRRIL